MPFPIASIVLRKKKKFKIRYRKILSTKIRRVTEKGKEKCKRWQERYIPGSLSKIGRVDARDHLPELAKLRNLIRGGPASFVAAYARRAVS